MQAAEGLRGLGLFQEGPRPFTKGEHTKVFIKSTYFFLATLVALNLQTLNPKDLGQRRSPQVSQTPAGFWFEQVLVPFWSPKFLILDKDELCSERGLVSVLGNGECLYHGLRLIGPRVGIRPHNSCKVIVKSEPRP